MMEKDIKIKIFIMTYKKVMWQLNYFWKEHKNAEIKNSSMNILEINSQRAFFQHIEKM